jgi:predicted unusual protein kinase regulating ubiquinone biosynthesis (AarF/ABC1/UbiB family)
MRCIQVYLKKLGKLHDAVPAMPPDRVKKEVEQELALCGTTIDGYFSNLNLTHPLGSASISQVRTDTYCLLYYCY